MKSSSEKQAHLKIYWHPDRKVTETECLEMLGNFGEMLPEPLSSIVNISDYSKKIHESAEIGIAFISGSKAGLVAMYANNLETKKAFISMLSVDPQFRMQKVATNLLLMALDRARDRGMSYLTLKVLKKNYGALALYNSLGFQILDDLSDRLMLSVKI